MELHTFATLYVYIQYHVDPVHSSGCWGVIRFRVLAHMADTDAVLLFAMVGSGFADVLWIRSHGNLVYNVISASLVWWFPSSKREAIQDCSTQRDRSHVMVQNIYIYIYICVCVHHEAN